MRLSLGVCSGTFHSNSQPRKPTASNYCRLVDIFCSYNLTTCAYHYLRFTRPWGLLMTAAFRKGPGVSIAEKLKTRLTFKKSTTKIEKNLLPQDKMLSIPNYYRKNDNQNDNEKPNLTRLATLTSLQTINAS